MRKEIHIKCGLGGPQFEVKLFRWTQQHHNNLQVRFQYKKTGREKQAKRATMMISEGCLKHGCKWRWGPYVWYQFWGAVRWGWSYGCKKAEYTAYRKGMRGHGRSHGFSYSFIAVLKDSHVKNSPTRGLQTNRKVSSCRLKMRAYEWRYPLSTLSLWVLVL